MSAQLQCLGTTPATTRDPKGLSPKEPKDHAELKGLASHAKLLTADRRCRCNHDNLASPALGHVWQHSLEGIHCAHVVEIHQPSEGGQVCVVKPSCRHAAILSSGCRSRARSGRQTGCRPIALGFQGCQVASKAVSQQNICIMACLGQMLQHCIPARPQAQKQPLHAALRWPAAGTDEQAFRPSIAGDRSSWVVGRALPPPAAESCLLP